MAANYVFGKMRLTNIIMSALSNAGGFRRMILPTQAAACSKINWQDARREYDQSVTELLAPK